MHSPFSSKEIQAGILGRIGEWEDKRAGKIAAAAAVQAGGFFAMEHYARGGVQRKIWRQIGGSCPLCQTLDGRVVGIKVYGVRVGGIAHRLGVRNGDLLLDVNNVYVNSVNHGYDAGEFLRALPGQRVVYGHIAGHYREAEDLVVDTHGSEVVGDVWDLLDKAYEAFGVFPTLLERDFNIPPLPELLGEIDHINTLQARWSGRPIRHGARHA